MNKKCNRLVQDLVAMRWEHNFTACLLSYNIGAPVTFILNTIYWIILT